MPLPMPKTGESREEFIARFMGDATAQSEFADEAQRAGVAYSQWIASHTTNKALKDVPFEAWSVAKFKAAGDDKDGGTLSGYASVWGVKDLEHDIIRKGTFAKTLSERVAAGRVPLMTRHLAHGGGPKDVIGWMTDKSKEDDVGLWAEFKMLATPAAQEMRALAKSSLEAGYPFGLSVEFLPVVVADREEGKGHLVSEAKLLQVTLTPTPMNEATVVTGVKSKTMNRALRARAKMLLATAR